jgi:membrane protease YdiL (CAAX protease family)
MSEKSLDNKLGIKKRTPIVLGLLFWVTLGFLAAQALITAVVFILSKLGVPFQGINPTILQTIFAVLVYAVTLAIVVGVPWWVRKYKTNRQELGLTRLPSWLDLALAPAGFIIYMLATVAITSVVSQIVPGFDLNQAQETGFGNIAYRYEFVLAFITLVVLAPIAEEVLFRGYLYGKLRKYAPAWVAILLTSALFGVVHGQWNVGLDVFALSLVLCTLREITGSVSAGIVLHMMKNALAFYILFINPALFNTIGG